MCDDFSITVTRQVRSGSQRCLSHRSGSRNAHGVASGWFGAWGVSQYVFGCDRCGGRTRHGRLFRCRQLISVGGSLSHYWSIYPGTVTAPDSCHRLRAQAASRPSFASDSSTTPHLGRVLSCCCRTYWNKLVHSDLRIFRVKYRRIGWMDHGSVEWITRLTSACHVCRCSAV